MFTSCISTLCDAQGRLRKLTPLGGWRRARHGMRVRNSNRPSLAAEMLAAHVLATIGMKVSTCSVLTLVDEVAIDRFLVCSAEFKRRQHAVGISCEVVAFVLDWCSNCVPLEGGESG